MSLTQQVENGVLTLSFNTPNSPVNILDETTAKQLVDVFDSIDTKAVKLVCLKSTKEHSFLNGTSLLLTSQSTQDRNYLAQKGQEFFKAYEAISNSPVPTVAIISGTCWGCGLELVLTCQYRIAKNTPSTQFYMTEINDYLFVPFFKGIFNLPKQIGLKNSIDMILWGKRLNSDMALSTGLVDQVFETAAQEQVIVETLGSTSKAESSTLCALENSVLKKTQERINQLPKHYQAIYQECFDLIVLCIQENDYSVDKQSQVLRSVQNSLFSKTGKATFAYFMIRRIADLNLAKKENVQKIESETIQEQNNYSPLNKINNNIILYYPYKYDNIRLVELISKTSTFKKNTLALQLEQKNIIVVQTNSSNQSAVNHLIDAYISPIKQYLKKDGDIQNVNYSLNQFGFIRKPHQLLTDSNLSQSDYRTGNYDPILIAACMVSLLAGAQEMLSAKLVKHPAIIDVLARELLDFPLYHISLCRYLTREQVSHYLEETNIEKYCSEQAIQIAQDYTTRERNIYL